MSDVLPPRQRILAVADDLFRRHGIRGVGVEAIAEAAGTNKMTLYRHFESKDELIAEWMRGIIAQKDQVWDDMVAKYPDDPTAQIIDWSRKTAAALAQMEERGSAILNALAELPEADHPARRVIDEHRLREHARLLILCRLAGFPDPELTADQFFFLLEGAKSCVQCIGLKRVGEHLVQLVDSMVTARGREPAPEHKARPHRAASRPR
ncbi:MAG TPA: helix-turn-helix domain-containing protein [Gemmatimonadaceae bacterium]|nr:helix-turn-helix domain-containing protein [Gemmatimonadaceae bacterium]